MKRNSVCFTSRWKTSPSGIGCSPHRRLAFQCELRPSRVAASLAPLALTTSPSFSHWISIISTVSTAFCSGVCHATVPCYSPSSALLVSKRYMTGTTTTTNGSIDEGVAPAAAAARPGAVKPVSRPRVVAKHSLLRHLIPLRLQGTSQPPSVLLRHALLHREDLFLPSILTSLASAPPSFPTTQRVLLAEAFQMVLEGDRPQREIREAFENAELACRRALLDLDEIDSSYFTLSLPPPPSQARRRRGARSRGVPGGNESSSVDAGAEGSADAEAEAEARAAHQRYQKMVRKQVAAEHQAWMRIRTSALHRLWMFELRAASTYYARLFSIPTTSHTTSFDVAALAVHTIVAADVRRDALLTELVLRWEEAAVKSRAMDEETVLHWRRQAEWSPWWSSRYWQWRWRRWRAGGAAAAMRKQLPAGGEYFYFMHRLKTGELLQQESKQQLTGAANSGAVVPYPRAMPPLREEAITPSSGLSPSSSPPPPSPSPQGGEAHPPTSDPSDWNMDDLIYSYGRDIHRGPQHAEVRMKATGAAVDADADETEDPCSLASYVYDDDDLVIRELLLLERDCFGRFRFDPRGDNRHFFHLLQLEHVGKTWASASVIFHPLMRAFGGFVLQYAPMANGRWIQLEVECGEEDHRLLHRRVNSSSTDPQGHELPLFEEIQTVAEDEAGLWGNAVSPPGSSSSSSARISFMARYNDPICYLRLSATEKERREARHHKEKFELAIETPREDEEVRLFSLDRWFRNRV